MHAMNLGRYFGYTLLFLMLTAVVFRFIWIKRGMLRNWAINISVFCFVSVFSLLAAEYYFSTYYIVPDALSFTLASRLWFDKYWQPINSLGYRDVEHPTENLKTRKKLYVVGDSIVAGHGIEKTDDRFADLLAKGLGTEWETVVIALNGWGTNSELRALQAYPAVPDTIILSYYLNDIDETLLKLTGAMAPIMPKVQPGRAIQPLVNGSYFFNALYWRYYRRGLGSPYWQWLEFLYRDPEVWGEHVRELKSFVEYARQQKANLIVLIWPNLTSMEKSKAITTKVDNYLKSEKVKTINLSPLFEGRDPADLIVNALDGHPNEAVHSEVAALLLAEIRGETPK